MKNRDPLLHTKVPLRHLYAQLSSFSYQSKGGIDALSCLPSLPFTPEHWQVTSALRVLQDMGGSAILADEVGLGKTIEAGLIIKELLLRQQLRSVILFVPASLVEQWKREMLEKFQLSFTDVKEIDMEAEEWQQERLFVSSLPYASRSEKRKKALRERAWDLVLVDEAHALKNHRTKSYQFIFGLERKHTLLLSATPFQNDLRELFNLVNIIKPGYFKSRRTFRETYMKDRYLSQHTAKLKTLLDQVMIRHRRSDTLVKLKNRSVAALEVEMKEEETSFYHEVIAFCRDIYQHYAKSSVKVGWDTSHVTLFTLLLVTILKQNASSPHSVIRTLQEKVYPTLDNEDEKRRCEALLQKGTSLTVPAKAEHLLSLLNTSDERWIVYSEYIPTLRMLQEFLVGQGKTVYLYYGGMSAREKDAVLSSFEQEEGSVLLSSESGGQGINLQFCHQMVQYDLPWNPMRLEQRIGRIHRFGQKETANIYMLPAKGTMDEYVLYILTSKIHLFTEVIGALDPITTYDLHPKKERGSLEVAIGKMILEATDSWDLERKLRSVGEQLAQKEEI